MIREITLDELEDILADGAELIDVREEDEVEAGAIPGHKHMALSEFDTFKDEISQTKTTVFYCRSGARSMKACKMAEEWTDQQLWSLAGGYLAWAEENETT